MTMMGDQQLAKRVLGLVEDWRPTKAYGHENKFQTELQEYLDERLNESGGGMTGGILGGGGGDDHAVHKERGTSRGDVVVDDIVGIELKRDLSNSQAKKLRGQIESYRENYPFVIVCACGIKDMSGWRELKNKYSGGGMGMGFGMEQKGEVRFVHKKKDNFGTDSGNSSTGGFFD